MLKLTLAPFDHKDDLQQIPEMHFGPADDDYWILLPVFEKIEEKTGKLIDLGDDYRFNQNEIETMQIVLEQELFILSKEVEEDSLLERDNETLKNLIERLSNMLRLAVLFKTDFLATTYNS